MMDFEAWKIKIEGLMAGMMTRLSVTLPDDGESLWKCLAEVEGHLGYWQYSLAGADRYLDEAESQALGQIIREEGSKIPAYEKEVRVGAMVSPQRELRDKIKGIVASIETRIMLGQSRLRYLRDLQISDRRET